jgi:hypothetical protein
MLAYIRRISLAPTSGAVIHMQPKAFVPFSTSLQFPIIRIPVLFLSLPIMRTIEWGQGKILEPLQLRAALNDAV